MSALGRIIGHGVDFDTQRLKAPSLYPFRVGTYGSQVVSRVLTSPAHSGSPAVISLVPECMTGISTFGSWSSTNIKSLVSGVNSAHSVEGIADHSYFMFK